MQGRRGTLYHVSRQEAFKHQTSVADLKAIKRFSNVNFATSAAGILKILAIIVFLVTAVIFLATNPGCSDPIWWLFPLVALVIVTVLCIMYALFMLGMAEDNTNFWVELDLFLILIGVIVSIIMSVLTFTDCDGLDTASQVPGPLGLAGTVILVMYAAALFVMWRSRDEEPPVATEPATVEERPPARKSVYV